MNKYKVMERIKIYNDEPFLPAMAIEQLFQGKDFLLIRAWLKSHDLDPHLMLELTSTEIAFVTPWGIMLQVRTADNGKLGCFGGVVRHGETVRECAVREAKEELGIKLNSSDLKFVEDGKHTHIYANGDKALFRCYRFVYELQEIPEAFEFDQESDGVEFVRTNREDILQTQQDFVKRCVEMYFGT